MEAVHLEGEPEPPAGGKGWHLDPYGLRHVMNLGLDRETETRALDRVRYRYFDGEEWTELTRAHPEGTAARILRGLAALLWVALFFAVPGFLIGDLVAWSWTDGYRLALLAAGAGLAWMLYGWSSESIRARILERRGCWSCQRLNWLGDRYCRHCGQDQVQKPAWW